MNQPPRPGQGATAAQIKHDIDSGRTGDKTAGFDPAAAPLGADDEAAGTPYDPQLLQAARARERGGRPAERRPNSATPELAPDGRARHRVVSFILAALVGVAAAIVVMFVLAITVTT
jgi:hypothetical protein